jgi:hypothetical protein
VIKQIYQTAVRASASTPTDTRRGGSDAGRVGAKSPTLAVWALKDPGSGNLDLTQIIKSTYNTGTGGST